VEGANVSDGDTLADEVEINLNMLCALMLDGVSGDWRGIPHQNVVSRSSAARLDMIAGFSSD
jgi:hypothetical protein